MLSDEEKQAIKELIDSNNLSLIGDGTCINSRRTIGTILNLIEKHSKEIEELKEKNDYLPAWVGRKYVSKDKIKAKIEELEKDFKEYENGQEWEIQDEIRGQIDILQSLLEKE